MADDGPSRRPSAVQRFTRGLSYSLTNSMPRIAAPPPTTSPTHVHNPPPPPNLLPWYFYTSPHPLDDPLSPLPPTTSTATTTKYPPRPFSAHDAQALELAYQELLLERQNLATVRNGTASSKSGNSDHVFKFMDKRKSIEFSVPSTGPKDLQPVEVSEEGHTPQSVAIPIKDRRISKAEKTISLPDSSIVPASLRTPSGSPSTSSTNRAGTTSNPFIRAPSHRQIDSPRDQSMSRTQTPPTSPTQPVVPALSTKTIVVGVQRLHQVQLPALQLEPIYWSPLHGLDNAGVIRGTWFYRDTMLPVESEKANALEKGWKEVQAWTDEWKWELEAAVRVGEEAEVKIRWSIPSTLPESRPATMEGGFNREVTFLDSDQLSPTITADVASGEWVIFADPKTAYIMRDNLLAGFAGVNRRPLATIKRGKTVGVPVVRGFDEETWRNIHNKDPNKAKTRGGVREEEGGREEQQKVTDLFLVIHGIGQKLSERVESFHFTHAINSFRRLANLELRDPTITPILRRDGVGVQILPINWRSKLKFDADLPVADDDLAFTLADITIPTIPAVRNIMGDVMLDIPYYLSHHKQKMINAVIKECNKVYRLWCHNNPTFLSSGGKVHIIAHSLGSVIALDILSAQPTFVDPTPSDIRSITEKTDDTDAEDETHFEFNTCNLFTAGSPAAFFLLLNRRGLLPRIGRGKPMDEGLPRDTCGDQGTYGCLAVDNIYNIMNYSDPIAYLLNPTVDQGYASSLRRAHVPSTAATWLSSLSAYLPIYAAVPPAPVATIKTTPSAPQRLPSTIELETHNFSREELAESRMHLLNDNGQLDWYLRAGGPLENAYLNMLGAHSSYWESRDFVRLLVMEVGRYRGRDGVVEGMRGQKKRGGMVGRSTA